VFTHYGITTGNNDWHIARRQLGNYWIFTRFPIIEAGGVNATLAIIALLPLTMCRFTISRLSETSAAMFIPLKRLERVHVFFAWLMAILFTTLLAAFIPFILAINNLGYYPSVLSFTNQMFIT
jgi:hypothetical protein